MKRIKRLWSGIIVLAMIMSFCRGVCASASSYLHQDEDAALDTAWAKETNYDADHGNVYKFASGANYDGTTWFTEEFADGTYVLSMDFKMSGAMAADTASQILVDSETWQDRTSFLMHANGGAAIAVQDASGVKLGTTYARYGNNWTTWNNYSIVYEKNGTDVDVTQYLNGIKLNDAVSISDNFRFKRMTIVARGGVYFYLDNITCRKIESTEELSIEKVSPVLSGSSVTKLLIKCNAPIETATVSSVTVQKSGGANLVTSYSIVGQCIEASVSGLAVGDKYSLSLGGTPQSIVGTVYGQSVSYLHQDEDAALDTAWAKETNYDADHGNVYKFASGTNYDGTTWFTEEFADGTYVVSMDFKMSGTMTAGTSQILIDSETWQDRTSFRMSADGTAIIAVQDSSGDKLGTYYAMYNNHWDIWNNYSVVYEKNGTNVDITQYLNGRKLHDAVRISDNFRFKRMTIVAQGGVYFYLDNITCRKIESAEALSIEKVSPVLSGSSVTKLLIKCNAPIVPSTVSSVTVQKSGGANLVTSYSVVGQCIEASVSGLSASDEYTISLGGTPQSITGNNYDGKGYTYENDILSSFELYDGSTKLYGFDSSCANKTLKVVGGLFNNGNPSLTNVLITALYKNNQRGDIENVVFSDGEEISKSEGVVLSQNIAVPAGIDGNYKLSSFVWEDLIEIRPLSQRKDY